MSTPRISVAISEDAIDVGAAISAAGTTETGGTGVFVGTVRVTPSATDEDKDVVGLEYEAHPSLAAQTLSDLASQAAEKWALVKVVAIHRTGRCEVGEPTVVVACSAAHRAPALEACRWLINEIKSTVPIWKKEIYADGSSWVGAR